MLRNIYLEGEMGERFGTGFQVNAPKIADVIKCIECNHPDFRGYLIECHEKNIGFEIDIANSKLDYVEELLMNLQEGDVTITPLAAGSKSGGGKILGAIALAALAMWGAPFLLGTSFVPGTVAAGGTITSMPVLATPGLLGTAGAGLGAVQMGLGMMALNLAMSGITQAMAPDPATDADMEESYLFNGNQQNIVEGDPVPVLYGRLRVPGQPINFEVAGTSSGGSIPTSFIGTVGSSNYNTWER